MTKPWRKAMPGVVLHGAHLRRSPEGIRHPLGGALVIGRKSDADMAIVEDRVVRPIRTFELVQALRRMRLVENDHSVEIGPQPFDDLPDARKLLAALIAAPRSVGRKKDAFRPPDRRALP